MPRVRYRVHADLDLAGVPRDLDGLNDHLERLLVGLDVGGEAALVTDVAGVLTVLGLDDLKRLGESGTASDCKAPISMRSAWALKVDHIMRRVGVSRAEKCETRRQNQAQVKSTFLRWWYVSVAIFIASATDDAPEDVRRAWHRIEPPISTPAV